MSSLTVSMKRIKRLESYPCREEEQVLDCQTMEPADLTNMLGMLCFHYAKMSQRTDSQSATTIFIFEGATKTTKVFVTDPNPIKVPF